MQGADHRSVWEVTQLGVCVSRLLSAELPALNLQAAGFREPAMFRLPEAGAAPQGEAAPAAAPEAGKEGA